MRSSDQQYIVSPFPAFPSVSRYVPVGSIADCMTRVCRSVDAQEGVSLVIGPPGTGKSLLCNLLVDKYCQTHEVAVLGETPMEDPLAYQRHLLHHLGVDYRELGEQDLHLSLVERVCGQSSSDDGLLIVIDEAQALSAEVLEAVRMSTNIHLAGQPRVFAVLAGGVKLDETLAAPSMEAFSQRIAARCYLHPMNTDETRTYIHQTILACGADPQATITDDAIAAVHHACCGVPRLINQIMTEAIDIAEASGESTMNDNTIDLAWAQLQQLPSPMIESPSVKSTGAPIEYGELQDFDGDQFSMTITGSTTSDSKVEMDITTNGDAMLVKEPPHECVENETEVQSLESNDEQSCDEPVVPPAPSSTTLFGEFEDEEEVSIGNATQVAPEPTNAEQPSSTGLMTPVAINFDEKEYSKDTSCSDDVIDASMTVEVDIDQSVSSADEEQDRCKDLQWVVQQEMLCVADASSSAHVLTAQEHGFTEQVDSTQAVCCDYTTSPRIQLNEEDFIDESFTDEPRGIDESILSNSENENLVDSSDESAEQGTIHLRLHDEVNDGTLDDALILESDQAAGGASITLSSHDDRDLLIIEEDVDLHRDMDCESSVQSSASTDESVSVDFHSMLQRMRTGTEG